MENKDLQGRKNRHLVIQSRVWKKKMVEVEHRFKNDLR